LSSLKALALVTAVFVVFWPAVRAPLLIDDALSLVENPTIARLWPVSVPLSPPDGGRAVSGRPTVNLSFAINFALSRPAAGAGEIDQQSPPAGFRIGNILLHLLCGALLFGVIRRTSARKTATPHSTSGDTLAWVVVAIWLLHPIQTEAVNYIVQRTELMASAACLGTLYASIRAFEAVSAGGAAAWIGIAASACLLGMGSKEVVAVTPAIVLLYDRAFLFDSWREAWRSTNRRWLYGLLVATLIPLVLLQAGNPRSDSVGFNLGVSSYEYLYGQAWAIAHYLRLVVWPNPLIIDYGQQPVAGLRPIPGALIVVALAAGTIWCWTRVKNWGWLAFTGATFFLLLAPSSSFVPIRTEFAAERRVYLAFACVLIALMVGMRTAYARIRARFPNFHAVAALARHGRLVFIALLAALGVVSFRRSIAYAEPEKLWRPVVESWPNNARGYSNLGMAIAADSTRFPEAESLFRNALEKDSTLAAAWLNLAYIQATERRLADADSSLGHAIALRDSPTYATTVRRYGRLLVEMREPQRAIPYLEQAVARNGSDDDLFWLGVGYFNAGRSQDAANAFRRTLQRNPQRTDAMRSLGQSLIESGKSQEAIEYLKAAAVREPQSGIGWALISAAEANVGAARDAIDAAHVSAKVSDDPKAHLVAGNAMLQLHQAAEAQWHFEQAIRLAADSWEAYSGLGIAEAAAGDKPRGIRALRHALELHPNYGPARDQLARLQGLPTR
jgi:tetratricopeptide (TPR) repeat protein